MPQLIEVPGEGQVEFPDEMSDDQIAAAIKGSTVSSTTAKIVGTIPKAAYALNKGVESAVADMGAGVARLSDPGPLPRNYRTYRRAMELANSNVEPQPIDFNGNPVGLDPLTKAMAKLSDAREQRRFQATLPGKSLEQAAREAAGDFARMEQATPGSETVAGGAEMVGGMLPLVAASAVPVVGPAAGIVMGGTQTTGSVYNEALAAYRKMGYSEDQAQRLADQDARAAGARNALVFAALPGAGNKVVTRLMGDQFAAKPLLQALARTGGAAAQTGVVMASDTALRDAAASQSYNPTLTFSDAAKDVAKSFAVGAVTGGIMHGPQEFAKLPKANPEADALEGDLGTSAPPPAGPLPPSRQLRNAPIITPPPDPGPPTSLTAIEMLLRDAPPLETKDLRQTEPAVEAATPETTPEPAAATAAVASEQLVVRKGLIEEVSLAQKEFESAKDSGDPEALVGAQQRYQKAAFALQDYDVGSPRAKAEAQARGAEAAANRAAKLAARPVLPETPAEPRESVVETIRRSNARTIKEIQNLFPAAELNRERAREFRDAAFPELEQPVQTPEQRADFLDRADDALGARMQQVLKEGRTNFLGDPELGALAIARGAVKIAKGVRDFTAWSAEMVKEFGEKIQPHLQSIWEQAHQVINGEHPKIGLSERGIKLVGDETLSDPVRDQINPLYQKRSNETDTDISRRVISDAGGAQAAAQQWLRGAFRDAPGSVQTILGSEIQRGLANQERALRSQGKTGEVDAIVQQQIKLTEADIARATDTAQALQAFQAHYANWTPSAWLANFRKTVTRVAADRVGRATNQDIPADPKEIAQTIANEVANELKAKQPKLAKTIEDQYGGKAEPKPLEERLKQNGSPPEKVKATAKKIESFYQKEVAKWRRKYGIPEFDAATEKEIIQRANDLEKLPQDSVQRREKAQDLFNHLQKLKGFSKFELGLDFWYANILSGLSTHAKNVLGNAVNLGAEAGIQVLRNPTAIPQIIEALGRALPRSAREGANILKTGHDTASRVGKFETPSVLEKIENPVASKLLMPWKLVGRFLKAEDVGFFYPLQEMKGVIDARRQAASEGVPIYGGKRAQRARAIMGWTAEARAKAEAQATREGLAGNQHARRVGELIEQSRPPQLMENARDFAFLGTFNNDPYGVLGALTNGWEHVAQQVPALKLVVPFTRIVSNLSNSMLNWTPVGTFRAGRAQGYKLLIGRPDNTGKLYGKAVTDPAAVGDLYARSIVGTAALGAIAAAAGQYVLDQNPKFMVSAQGPTDADQRELLKESGWIPYSLKLGDRYYSYQDKPLALPMSIVGHYMDAVRYRKLEQQDALNRVAYATGAAGNVILNSSWLQGVSQVFNTANRDSTKSPLKALPSQLVKTGSSFVVPNAVRQIDQIFDDTKYTADDIRSMLLREVPFARRENQPDLNVFGEPIHQPMSKIFMSKVEGDRITQTLAGRRLWPSVPVEGEMTPAQQYQLMKDRGPLLRAALAKNLAEIQTLPHADAQKLVSSISRRVTVDAKKTLGLDDSNQVRKELRQMRER